MGVGSRRLVLLITRMSLEEESDICGDQDGDRVGLKELDQEEAKREERLRMLLVNMLELAERQSRWKIKADKVEEEWKEAMEERRRMRKGMEHLVVKLATVSGKLGIQLARMKIQMHVEWIEEVDAMGKRLAVELEQLIEELEEINKLKEMQEKEEEILKTDLGEVVASRAAESTV